MSKSLNAFFSKELTIIPRIMQKYIGNYFSNMVGNALTSFSVSWFCLHLVFELYLDLVLSHMKYRIYIKKRLFQGLWYCCFYGCCFGYCLVCISSLQIEAGTFKNHILKDVGHLPQYDVLLLTLFGSIFLHSCVWDLFKLGRNLMSASNFLLMLLPLLICYTRRLDFFWVFMGLVSLYRFCFNILRTITASDNINNKCYKLFIYSVFFTFLLIFGIIHFLLIPIFLIVPLAMNIMSNDTITGPLTMLLILLIVFWIIETFNNPLYKFGYHWIYYKPRMESLPDSIMEYSLFPIRDDDAYVLRFLIQKIRLLDAEAVLKGRPTNRSLLIQTLKSMMAMKKKLNKMRRSESSEEEESEVKKDSDEDISSSSEENSEDEDEEKRQYQEETAKVLLEDRMESLPKPEEDGAQIPDTDDNKKHD